MNSPENKPFLESERAQTDDSLTTERGKTDKSLSQHLQDAERKTDEQIKNDRDLADWARAQRRSDTDLIRRSESDPKNSTIDRKADKGRLTQRQFDDKTVESERALMDAALLKERGVNRTVASELLRGERAKTDENLMQERNHTDSQVQRVSGLLIDEQSSHLVTKDALTTRDEFLAIVSHDLRNPIGAILSYTDLLSEDGNAHGLSGKARNWIEVIKRNAQTSLQLINDILDIERYAAGKFHLDLAKHSVQSLVEHAVESFEQLCVQKEITITSNKYNSASIVTCDPKRVEQILSNLIGNAIKFTPKGGSIKLGLSQIENNLVVSVADSGRGIADEEKARIFDRFAQINNKDRNGLGLGLYISQIIVEAHRGRIWVTSHLGQGSTFSFTLPQPR